MNNFDASQIAGAVLLTDGFYRLLQRGSPPVAYERISQLAQQHLQSLIMERSKQWTLFTEARLKELSEQLLIETWQTVLGEVQLKALAVNVQQYELRTTEFQKALNILHRAFSLSKRLKKRPSFASEETYREAQNILQLWICRNIHKFDPERGDFIKWINFNFDRHHIPQATEVKQKKRIEEKFGQHMDNYDFDRLPSPTLSKSSSCLLDWLQEDYIFRIPNRDKPDITFLDIALSRIQNHSWKDIANRFEFNGLSTPSRFFQSWLKKLTTPLIEEKLNSNLYTIRLARFEGEAWANIANGFLIEENILKEKHQKQLDQFPSYQTIVKESRHTVSMARFPHIKKFSRIARILLETGHLWKEPADVLKENSVDLKEFYLDSLQVLWPHTPHLHVSNEN